MPALDDGAVVKLYNSNPSSPIVDEVMIGTPGSGTNQRLASFVTTINGTPDVKSYIDGDGVYNGDVSGDIAGDIAGNVTGDVTGNVTGNLTGNVTGDIAGAVAATTLTAATSSALTGAVTLPSLAGTPSEVEGTTINTSARACSVVHKITATYSTFADAALTKDVTLWTLPAKTRVVRVIADVTTKFLGGAISAVVMRCGKAADGAEYLVDKDVFTAEVTAGETVAERGAALVDATSNDITWGSTQIVNVRLTATTANLSELTQGSMTLYIECVVYP